MSYADSWVAHTLEVQKEIVGAETALQRARAEQRSYLITRQPVSLDGFSAAFAELTSHITKLKSLTADNPRQQTMLNTLEPLIRARGDTFSATIRAANTGGLNAARGSMSSRHSAEQDGDITTLLQRMHAEER